MKLLVDNKEFPYVSVQITEHIEQYYSTVVLELPSHISARKVVLRYKQDYPLIITRQYYTGNTYIATCYAEGAHRLLNMVTNPVCGFYTIEELCAEAGVPCECSYKSAKTFWMLPSLKIASFIKEVTKYGWHVNGGGCRCYINLEGKLHIIDMKSASESTPFRLIGDITGDTSNSEWALYTVGSASLISYHGLSVDTSTLNIEGDVSKGTLRINDTTGYLTEMKEHQLMNEYWAAKFLARRCTFATDGVYNIQIGKEVTYRGVNFTCIGYTFTNQVNGSPTPTVVLNLATSI